MKIRKDSLTYRFAAAFANPGYVKDGPTLFNGIGLTILGSVMFLAMVNVLLVGAGTLTMHMLGKSDPGISLLGYLTIAAHGVVPLATVILLGRQLCRLRQRIEIV